MNPIYEIRFKEPNGVISMTKIYGGADMITHLNNMVTRGWNILSCVIV